MKQFLSFVRKEFIHILRDPRSLLILLVMPQILVLLPGFVIKNDVKDIRVAVIDKSRDVYTEMLTQKLYANDYFIGKGEVSSEEEATDLFRKGEIDLVVIFGPGFADRMMHSHDASIQILSDGSEPNQASVRVAYSQQVMAGFPKGTGTTDGRSRQKRTTVQYKGKYTNAVQSAAALRSQFCSRNNRYGHNAYMLHDDFNRHCPGA